MATKTDQQRSSPSMKDQELEKLRIRTWFFYVVERAIGQALDTHQRIAWQNAILGQNETQTPLARSLQKWLDEQSKNLHDDQIDAVTQLTARNYEMGEQSPRAFTLGVFEKLLGGSQAIYDVGPLWLPLWKILDGDLVACRSYLDTTIPLPQLPDAGPEDKLQAIMNALIAPIYQLNVKDIPDLGSVQLSAHPVWLTRINEAHRVLNEIEDPRSVRVESKDGTEVGEYVLAAIALWQLISENGVGPALRMEWLMVGLCYGVIFDVFGEEVQAYVLKLLKERATGLQNQLAKRGVQVLPFADRWKTVMAVLP